MHGYNVVALPRIQDVEKPVKKVPYGNPQRQDGKPVLLEKRNPFIAVWEALVFHQLPEEYIAPNGAKPKCNWVKDEPEDNVLS